MSYSIRLFRLDFVLYWLLTLTRVVLEARLPDRLFQPDPPEFPSQPWW